MRVINGLIAALVAYLIGAFYSAGFDISQWTDGTRFVTCMTMVGAFDLTLIAPKFD